MQQNRNTPTPPTKDGRGRLELSQTNNTQEPFVPWFDRSDLPPNRISKKRVNKKNKTIPSTLNELLNQHTGSSPCSPSDNNQDKEPATTDKYRTANDHVLNYLKEVQHRQLQQKINQQIIQPLHNVSVSVIKSQLLFQKTRTQPVVPSYTLSPTVNDIISRWEQKKHAQEELTHEQRLQKERLVILQQQSRSRSISMMQAPSPSTPSSTSSSPSSPLSITSPTERNRSASVLNKNIPKLNLPHHIFDSNNANPNDICYSNSSSTCSSVDEDREHTFLPSFAKLNLTLNLPKLNLPTSSNDPSRETPRSAPTPRNYFLDMSPNSPQPNTPPTSVPSTGRNSNRRYYSPRHAPYPSPNKSTGSRQNSPVDANNDINKNQQHYHIQQQQQLFEAVFKYTPCSMCIVSDSGHLVCSNKSMCDMLGYADHELNDKNLNLIVPDGASSSFMNQLNNGSLNQNSRFTQEFIHKNGTSSKYVCGVGIVQDFSSGSFFIITVVDW